MENTNFFRAPSFSPGKATHIIGLIACAVILLFGGPVKWVLIIGNITVFVSSALMLYSGEDGYEAEKSRFFNLEWETAKRTLIACMALSIIFWGVLFILIRYYQL